MTACCISWLNSPSLKKTTNGVFLRSQLIESQGQSLCKFGKFTGPIMFSAAVSFWRAKLRSTKTARSAKFTDSRPVLRSTAVLKREIAIHLCFLEPGQCLLEVEKLFSVTFVRRPFPISF